MTTWVLILYTINGFGAPMQTPLMIEIANEPACREAGRVATADPKRGFSVALCIDTGFTRQSK